MTTCFHRSLLVSALVATATASTASADNDVFNVEMETSSPAALAYGKRINMTFDYETDVPDGVRIFFRPYTNGVRTPGYGAHGSPLHPVGEGSGEAFFTINSGPVTVDEVQIQMLNGDQSQLLLERFVPVTYHFSPSGFIGNVSLSPEDPASLDYGDQVTISFDYDVTEPGGVRIFPRPFTDGTLTPNYAASGSPIYTGAGRATATFTITAPSSVEGGAVFVNGLRFQMKTADQSATLLTFVPPVDYTFDELQPVREASWGEIKSLYK